MMQLAHGPLGAIEEACWDGGSAMLRHAERDLYAARLGAHAVIMLTDGWTVLRAGEMMAIYDGAKALVPPEAREELKQARNVKEIEACAVRHQKEWENRILACADWHSRWVERGGARSTAHWLESGVSGSEQIEMAAFYLLADKSRYMSRQEEDRLWGALKGVLKPEEVSAGDWSGGSRREEVDEILSGMQMSNEPRRDRLRHDIDRAKRELPVRGPDEPFQDYLARVPFGEFLARRFGAKWFYDPAKRQNAEHYAQAAVSGLIYAIGRYTPVRPSEPMKEPDLFKPISEYRFYCPPITRAIETGVFKRLFESMHNLGIVSVTRRVWDASYDVLKDAEKWVVDGTNMEEAVNRSYIEKLADPESALNQLTKEEQTEVLTCARSGGVLTQTLDIQGDKKNWVEDLDDDENAIAFGSMDEGPLSRFYATGRDNLSVLATYEVAMDRLVTMFHGASSQTIQALKQLINTPHQLTQDQAEALRVHLARSDNKHLHEFEKMHRWLLKSVPKEGLGLEQKMDPAPLIAVRPELLDKLGHQAAVSLFEVCETGAKESEVFLDRGGLQERSSQVGNETSKQGSLSR